MNSFHSLHKREIVNNFNKYHTLGNFYRKNYLYKLTFGSFFILTGETKEHTRPLSQAPNHLTEEKHGSQLRLTSASDFGSEGAGIPISEIGGEPNIKGSLACLALGY